MAKHYQSGFARALLHQMMLQDAQAGAEGDGRRSSPMRADWLDNLHPAIRANAEKLVAEGTLPLHDYVAALNSSQAFAMNLFLPIQTGDTSGLSRFTSEKFQRKITVKSVELEYFGSGDFLAEVANGTPRAGERHTAADVAIWLRDEVGRDGLLLVEVKLSENGFTRCGGVDSRGNRDRAPCDSAATFFEDPQRCYLRRPARGRRDRRYWELFGGAHGSVREAFPVASEQGECPFRGDWQQPMRNHALALAAVDAGAADFWGLALVHHNANPDVSGPWDSYAAATADRQNLFRWPVSELLPALDTALPGHASWLRERYLFDREFN